jgi:hypothetical protein
VTRAQVLPTRSGGGSRMKTAASLELGYNGSIRIVDHRCGRPQERGDGLRFQVTCFARSTARIQVLVAII